jgi:hypothetical protein
MEKPSNLVESLFEKLGLYGKTTYELSKLRALQKSADIAASVVARVAAIVILSLFVFILSIGIALLLGDWLGKFYYGFFVVAAFYLLAGIICLFQLHKWIKKPIGDLIISQVL